MAVTCARCGTQNPEGNQFCQACGTPLAVDAAPPGVPSAVPPAPAPTLPGPPGPPPGPPPPGAYQSPYYAPSAVGPQPPVHRTPWILIISAIVVLLLIMVGGGSAIAVLSHRGSGNQGGASGVLPSPSPPGTPSPTSPPTTTGSGTASNKGVTFSLLSGWTVANKDDETITVTNPNGDGSVAIASGPSNPTQTTQQNKETVDKFFSDKYPDTKTCAGSKTAAGTLNGASGTSWQLCFTLPAGSQSIQAQASLFAGANSDGSVYYLVILLTSQSNMKSFVSQAAPILKSIKWNLT